MKTKSLLTLALSLASATSLMASTVDVYITGATAFRANIFTACCRLYSGSAPANIYFTTDSSKNGDINYNNSTASWCMTGTPITGLTNVGTANTLVIHGTFTGSLQGLRAIETKEGLVFAQPSGTFVSNSIADFSKANGTPASVPLNTCNAWITNSATIAFSDADSAATTWPVANYANLLQEDVAVVPFVIVKSVSSGAGLTALNNVNNLTSDQLYFGITKGFIPLSSWTYGAADTNTPIYLLERSSDSGTRRNETAYSYLEQGDTVVTYFFDYTNNVWYSSSSTNQSTWPINGTQPGIIGSEGPGVNNDNLLWTSGYIGGGDIKNSLGKTGSANTALALLSMSDAKGITATNWSQVISFNGVWPTVAGAGIHGNTGTNDFSPVTSGQYPLWGKEVLLHLVDPSKPGDQLISKTALGSQTSPGSFMGVFNAQTLVSTNLNGIPVTGSIENEIELSKMNAARTAGAPATAIRLSDMTANRGYVGGPLNPF